MTVHTGVPVNGSIANDYIELDQHEVSIPTTIIKRDGREVSFDV